MVNDSMPSAPSAPAGPVQDAELDAQQPASPGSQITVVVRCRPLSERERDKGSKDVVRVLDEKLVVLLDPGRADDDFLRKNRESREKRFVYDFAFGASSTTQQIYDRTCGGMVNAVCDGFNATVLAYGSTGAGKTYTMLGNGSVSSGEPEDAERSRGIMGCMLEELFERLAVLREEHGQETYSVKCSFLEVYNENIRDLLTADATATAHEAEGRAAQRARSAEWLDLREDPIHGVFVAGITEVEEVGNARDIEVLLQHGNERRTTEPTAMNVTSSRSHAVLQVVVTQRSKQPAPADDGSGPTQIVGRLAMVDLAGSERAAQTENRGQRLLEGANINRSLLALGNCINALASAAPGAERVYVPYRNSKLTRLLKDSLGGNTRTLMISNVSPCHLNYEDTLNTLKYANRAKNIRLTAELRRNVVSADAQVGEYARIIEDLRGEVAGLKCRLGKAQQPSLLPAGLHSVEDLAPPPEASVDSARDAERDAQAEAWRAEVLQLLEERTKLQYDLTGYSNNVETFKSEVARIERSLGGRGDELDSSVKTVLPDEKEQLQEELERQTQLLADEEELHKACEEKIVATKDKLAKLRSALPGTVANSDLRTFLELVFKVQILEVERQELDHISTSKQKQLETKETSLRELRRQLKLRESHLASIQENMTSRQLRMLPGHVSLLNATFNKESVPQGDNAVTSPSAPPPSLGMLLGRGSGVERTGSCPPTGAPEAEPFSRDWRELALPQAEQIRGAASLAHANRSRNPRPVAGVAVNPGWDTRKVYGKSVLAVSPFRKQASGGAGKPHLKAAGKSVLLRQRSPAPQP